MKISPFQAVLIKILEAGWIGRQAILMTGINAIIYVLSTLPPSVVSYVHRPVN